MDDKKAGRSHHQDQRVRKSSSLGKPSSRPMEIIYGDVNAEVALHLDMIHMDIILRNIIAEFSSDQKLIKTARSISYKVGGVKKPVGKRIGGVCLEEIVKVMETLINNTPDLPSSVVAYVHTYLGLIRQQQEKFDGAIHAYIKALWIRVASHQPAELIAVASYRLGVAYILDDDIDNAKVSLKQSIQYYSQSSTMAMDHEFVLAAKKSLSEIKTQSSGDFSKSEQLSKKKQSRLDRDEDTVTTTDLTVSTGRRSLGQW